MNKIICVIMDWAGTSIDFGCFAPLNAFLKAFQEKGIEVTYSQIREPMGFTKIEHIRAMLSFSEIDTSFREQFGRSWTEEDVREINQTFEKYLFESLKEFTDPIPGVLRTMEALRARGIKIGSTTGYTEEMMAIVRPEAAKKGYEVDCLVTSKGLPSGRPAPYMIYRNMEQLRVPSVRNVVKVGDTVADIKEGCNAGVISIGVVTGSSALGLSQQEYEDMPPEEMEKRKQQVVREMKIAGADYVLDHIAELPECLDLISR